MNRFRYIHDLIRAGNYKEAEQVLVEAVSKEEVPQLWLTLAHRYYDLQEYAPARECFLKVQETGVLGPLGKAKLASCLMHTGARMSALEIVTELSHESEYLPQEALDLILRIGMMTNRHDVISRVEDNARRRFPNNSLYWYAPGVVAYQLEDYRWAISLFDHASMLAPDNASYRISLCRSLLKINCRSEALRVLDMDLAAVDCIAEIMFMKNLYIELDDANGIAKCCNELAYRYYQQKQIEFDF